MRDGLDVGTETCWGGRGAGCLLVLDLEVALRACCLECSPHCMSLKRKTQDTLPLGRAVDNSSLPISFRFGAPFTVGGEIKVCRVP